MEVTLHVDHDEPQTIIASLSDSLGEAVVMRVVPGDAECLTMVRVDVPDAETLSDALTVIQPAVRRADPDWRVISGPFTISGPFPVESIVQGIWAEQ